ncbi:MAG: FAD-dependent oxidoreductase, partial [Planctomycetota bacterium]
MTRGTGCVDADIDVLIFGGGGVGLWLLDELQRRGFRAVVLESEALGAGQTVASQGIIHGGIKYTLSGLFSESARAIRDMPGIWRDCLAGRGEPNLTGTRVAADYCHLWHTASLRSKLGMVGARTGLRSALAKAASQDRPAVLGACPGDVFRVDEQVIDPVSFVRDLAERHGQRTLKIDAQDGVEFVTSAAGRVDAVHLARAHGSPTARLRPRHVVFTAGAGNAALRDRVGLSADAMQCRPLHMV